MPLEFLKELSLIIENRKKTNPELSYTSKLFSEGAFRISQKVGEEGVETALAGVKGDKKEIISESADLIFHLMVLLANNNITLEDVVSELEKRHKK